MIVVNDVARAYFEAKVERKIAIELPDEDKVEGQDMVGIFEVFVWKSRRSTQFPKRSSEIDAVTRFRKATSIQVMVHGDDFVSSASRSSLL